MICFGLILMFCQPQQAPVPQSAASFCQVVQAPIKWSRKDTYETKAALDVQFAQWKALCQRKK